MNDGIGSERWRHIQSPLTKKAQIGELSPSGAFFTLANFVD
jgi:hypothetical protein